MNAVKEIPKKMTLLLPQTIKQVACFASSSGSNANANTKSASAKDIKPSKDDTEVKLKPKSKRYVEFEKKLRAKTPIGKLDEHSTHPHQEKEPLKPWPNNTNPHTGEIGGPAGPEPTRYGDWERKGRVSDF